MPAYKLTYENGTTHQQSPYLLHVPPVNGIMLPANFNVYGNRTIVTSIELNAAIKQACLQMPEGVPEYTTLTCTELVAGRTGMTQYVTPYWQEFLNLDRLGVGDRFYLKNGSYIEVYSISAGTSTYVNVRYKNKSDQICYDTSLFCSYSSSNQYNNHIRTIPWLLVDNIDYKLMSVEIYTGNGSMDSGLNAFFNSSVTITPVTTALGQSFWEGVEPVDEDDPYQDIEDSTPSGPADSDGIPADSNIDFPDLPTVSATDTGFVTLYNPTLAQVKSLADYMWSGLFDISTYKKIFADPMDCILGFNMLPVAIPHGTAKTVTVGNISTGIQMDPATSQWIEVDCGTIDMGDAFGSYLSYAPYTKVSMYLPYIGTVELSTDDLIGKTIALKYHIDALSCSCVAYLKCGSSVLYQFTGSCGYSIPVNSNDFRSTVASIISIAATIGGAVATGGLSAPAAVAAGASVAQNVTNSKPEIHRSGSIGSSAGIMGLQKPYLIVEYPNPCKPKKQYHYLGYPSFVTKTLSDLTGYAEFENVLLENIPCTDAERELILGMCKGGIYL